MRIKAWYKNDAMYEKKLVDIIAVVHPDLDMIKSMEEPSLIIIFVFVDNKIRSDIAEHFTVLTEEEIVDLEHKRFLESMSKMDIK